MIREKLMNVQSELKAPKGQYNSFGKYKYRSCEDILEAVKPIAAKYKSLVVVGDELVLIGERYYIKAVASFLDAETEERIDNTAWAREEAEKKGMDGSQITGTASSYARKYALNGLLCIDDTKDADTDENRKQREGKLDPEEAKMMKNADKKLSSADAEKLFVSAQGAGISAKDICDKYHLNDIAEVTYSLWPRINEDINKYLDLKAKKAAGK